MEVLFDGIEEGAVRKELPQVPRKGDEVRLNDTWYYVGVVTWYPDDDDSPDAILEVDRLSDRLK